MATNKIGKRRVCSCPKGQVTVSEQILSLAQNPWLQLAVSGSHEQDDCATKREMCHSGKPVPNGTMTAAK